MDRAALARITGEPMKDLTSSAKDCFLTNDDRSIVVSAAWNGETPIGELRDFWSRGDRQSGSDDDQFELVDFPDLGEGAYVWSDDGEVAESFGGGTGYQATATFPHDGITFSVTYSALADVRDRQTAIDLTLRVVREALE